MINRGRRLRRKVGEGERKEKKVGERKGERGRRLEEKKEMGKGRQRVSVGDEEREWERDEREGE